MDLFILEEAIAFGEGEFLLEDIISLSEQGKMHIWNIPNTDTMAVTEFVQYPRKKRLRVILLAGSFDKEVVTFFETLAKAMTLDGIEVIGRKGWVRALKPFGYHEASVNVLKDFADEGEE